MVVMTDNRTIKWIDGLRGVASFTVICTHLARAYDIALFSPQDSPEAEPRFLQLPFVRILWHGRLGVAIFAFLTGYVCALKPLQLIRDGSPERALSTIAKSAFRRVPRLVLPTIIITVIAWFLCQLGAFEVAKHTDSYYISDSSPVMSPNITMALFDLQRNLINTWTTGHDDYDDHQWTMLPLLRGSMLIFITLFATAYMQNRYRLMAAWGLYVYYYVSADEFSTGFGLQLFFGFILSSLSHNSSSSPQAHISLTSPSHVLLRILLPAGLLPAGLYLASYPGDHAEWAPWSDDLRRLATYIFPAHTANVPRFFTAIGLHLCLVAIHLSPHLKRLLSSRPFLWLGKHSFAVYLIHGTLLRTLLTMAFYGWTVPAPPGPLTDEQGNVVGDGVRRDDHGNPVPPEPMHLLGFWHNAFWIVPWFALVYYCAFLWTAYVDAACARATKKLEDYVFEEGEKSVGPLLS